MKTGFPRNDACFRGQGKRKGMILLSVLLVSMFLVSASVGFAFFARRTIRRFDREKRALVSRMVSDVALSAAEALLSLRPEGACSPLDEVFQPRTLSFPDAGVTVTFRILPLDDAIPINNLFLPDGKTLRSELAGPWRKLWKDAGAENLETAVLDFIDADKDPRIGGGEGGGPLNRALLSLEELLFVQGLTRGILDGGGERTGIGESVTLWSSGKINANTARPQVLALLDGLNMDIAMRITSARENRPLRSMEDLSAIPSFPSSSIPRLANIIAFQSEWFSVSFQVQFRDGATAMIQGILTGKPDSWELVRWEEL